MKIMTDDPILTSYVLDELSASDAKQVSLAIENDRSLKAEVAGLREMAAFLGGALEGGSFSLDEKRREEIFKEGSRPDAKILVLDHRRRARRQSIYAMAGVAAVVVLVFYVLGQMRVEKAEGVMAGGPDGSGAIPTAAASGGGIAQSGGRAEPSALMHSLNSGDGMPSVDHFEVKAWINAAMPSGEADLTLGGVNVMTEVAPLSRSGAMNVSKASLLVNLNRSTPRAERVKALLKFDPKVVEKVRLVGGDEDTLSDMILFDGSDLGSQTRLYEIDLMEGAGLEALGQLVLEIDDVRDGRPVTREGALYLQVDPAKASPSVDFKTALVLADFAEWGNSADRADYDLNQLAERARSLMTEVKRSQTRRALDAILVADEFVNSAD